MKAIKNLNATQFSLNDYPFNDVYQLVKDSDETVRLENIFEQDDVLFEKTFPSNISINGTVYENVEDLLTAFDNFRASFAPTQPKVKRLVFEAFLTQNDTDAPEVATLIEDTIQDVTLGIVGDGYYSASSPKFENNKVVVNGVNPFLTEDYELESNSFTGNEIILGGGPINNRKVIIPAVAKKTGNTFFFATRDNDQYANGVMRKYNAYIKIEVFVLQ